MVLTLKGNNNELHYLNVRNTQCEQIFIPKVIFTVQSSSNFDEKNYASRIDYKTLSNIKPISSNYHPYMDTYLKSFLLYYYVKTVLWCSNVHSKTKWQIYSTILQIIMLYGDETWNLDIAHEKKTPFYWNGFLITQMARWALYNASRKL